MIQVELGAEEQAVAEQRLRCFIEAGDDAIKSRLQQFFNQVITCEELGESLDELFERMGHAAKLLASYELKEVET